MTLTHSEKVLLIKALENFEKEKVRFIETDEDEDEEEWTEVDSRTLSPGQSVDLKNLTKKVTDLESVAPAV